MDKLTIINLIKNAYDISIRYSNSNGYNTSCKFNISQVYNTTNIEVENYDNQGQSWTDKFVFEASNERTLKADKAKNVLQIDFTDPIQCIKDIGNYVFTAIFQDYYDESLNEELMDIYLNKDKLQSMIEKLSEAADYAYGRYQYEEAAELDYNIDASSKAFSEYSENKRSAETLTKIKDALK